ncbi:hypothetical protein MASR2M78_03530 [Treponema sp.]
MRQSSLIAFFLAVLGVYTSCSTEQAFPVSALAADGKSIQLLSKAKLLEHQVLAFSKPLHFSFDQSQSLPSDSAFEIEYSYKQAGSVDTNVVFSAKGENSWVLPQNVSFLFPDKVGKRIRYRFPLVGKTLSAFSLSLLDGQAKNVKEKSSSPNRTEFILHSVRITERAYGYAKDAESVFISPYVYTQGDTRLIIDPPQNMLNANPVDIKLRVGESALVLKSGESSYSYSGLPKSHSQIDLSLSAGVLPKLLYPLTVEGTILPQSIIIESSKKRVFPFESIIAEPGVVLEYRQDAWRDKRYEVFSWERFPSILIFDTADYAVQDRLFKRLAFFTEKAGFRGRIPSLAEIALLHGWNAHDYRAEDLAAFFEKARVLRVPLEIEEKELLSVLLANGIVKQEAEGSAILPGSGAIISISRESEGYLRRLFMVHEAYHGLFFSDTDFRLFAASRWDSLDSTARKFLAAYFDLHRYDTKDRYLMTNELMAYCLQQPVSLASKYFGETLPSRLDKDERRRESLPEADPLSGKWPELGELFTQEASAFDTYVKNRWGLRAGIVSTLYIKPLTKAAR